MSESSFAHTTMSALHLFKQNFINRVYHYQISSQPAKDIVTLYFGKNISTATGHIHGGEVKLQRLQEYFPVSKQQCNILYLVSSSPPSYVESLITLAKERDLKIVWNQNGVSYPASDRLNWQKINKRMKNCIHKADYVIYQSNFCKDSANKFLGEYGGSNCVIYNCIDTDFFSPREEKFRSGPLTILLGGNQYKRYRLDVALVTIFHIKKEIPDVKLIVTGKIAWDGKPEQVCLREIQKTITNLGIKNNVEFIGKYTQNEAPALYRRADILLHTKWKDPSPGLVIEAMSCGLPVVFSNSGGVPEIVGKSAGIGVPAKDSWDEVDSPDPLLLSAAVLKVSGNLDYYSLNARKRAINKFHISKFIEQHKSIFLELLSK